MSARPEGDLSVTALYTSHVWVWGKFECAELFATPQARTVFWVTNIALAITRLFKWRLRSLRHALAHRHAMIDYLVRDAGLPQVLELAAGLSRRGATFSSTRVIRYVELDLPHVMKLKRELLEASAAGRLVLQRPNLELVDGDVADTDLEALIDDVPTLVIAEGLLMYLDPGQQQSLFERVATLLKRRTGKFVFDLVPAPEQPQPGVVGRILRFLMERFTGGRSFHRDQRSRHDIVRALREAGFSAVDLVEPAQVRESWKLPFPRKRTRQLLFICDL